MSSSLLSMALRQGLSLDWKFALLARLTVSSWDSLVSAPSNADVTGIGIHTWLFGCVLGIGIQAFRLVEQESLPADPPPGPSPPPLLSFTSVCNGWLPFCFIFGL